ncbi:hypothetical protein MBLNU230_g7759t1 [Neophaeotheca triangularis]
MAASTTSSQPSLPAFLAQPKTDIHAKFIDLEWQQRQRLLLGSQNAPTSTSPASSSEAHPFSRLSSPEVVARNRYLNVEPFAANRVKLRDLPPGTSDYINASPITLGKRQYIATQGPKDTNLNHFWRMLYQETASPAVVVMLTQTHEAGKEKCYQYYPLSASESPMQIPPEDASNAQGDFQGSVELVGEVNEDLHARSQVRKLRLRAQTGSSREEDKEVHHLLFSGWPDFLVPEGEDRLALLQLIQLSARLNRGPSSDISTTNNGPASASVAADFASTAQDNPRIIHCSAGVGRSGTFIALDYLLSLLHSGQLDSVPKDRDLIAETVDELRKQRMMMVQGEGQFVFLYEVLKEAWLARASERG